MSQFTIDVEVAETNAVPVLFAVSYITREGRPIATPAGPGYPIQVHGSVHIMQDPAHMDSGLLEAALTAMEDAIAQLRAKRNLSVPERKM